MEERIEISLLLDFYSSLLTEKQRDVMTLYYNDDLSLAEIAEINHTSRQAIHDLIKRCDKQLLVYEKKLNLLQKSYDRLEKKEEIVDFLKNILNKENLKEVEIKLEDLINF